MRGITTRSLADPNTKTAKWCLSKDLDHSFNYPKMKEKTLLSSILHYLLWIRSQATTLRKISHSHSHPHPFRVPDQSRRERPEPKRTRKRTSHQSCSTTTSLWWTKTFQEIQIPLFRQIHSSKSLQKVNFIQTKWMMKNTQGRTH